MDVALTVVLSAAVSALVAKAIAAYHFRVTDSYVKEIIEMAKEQIKKAYLSQDKR